MDDEYTDKAVRLLDIVHSLYGSDKRYPYENLPFSVSDKGAINLSQPLTTELAKEENNDLIDWAHENILSLFEWVVFKPFQ